MRWPTRSSATPGANRLEGGDGEDTLTGNAGADTLVGGADDDKLTGGAGADSMAGGAGDDIYDVDDAGDLILEAVNDGADLVNATVSHTLSVNVERLTLKGTASINGTGSGDDNTLTGNAAANLLSGMGGADTLSGGLGDDTLNGGAGVDKLTGGTGADRFLFQKGEAAGDIVVDFADGDLIELRGYGAGSTLTALAGGKNWQVTDGVTQATETIVLNNKYLLAAGDFLFT